jgi:hypothetical protein
VNIPGAAESYDARFVELSQMRFRSVHTQNQPPCRDQIQNFNQVAGNMCLTHAIRPEQGLRSSSFGADLRTDQKDAGQGSAGAQKTSFHSAKDRSRAVGHRSADRYPHFSRSSDGTGKTSRPTGRSKIRATKRR